MNKSRFLIALGVILCLVLSPVIALVPTDTAQAQLADSPWPMFRQNPQHTGRSPDGPPAFALPELKWDFPTEDWVKSSPAIGADGTIYVGSSDGKLYAVNPDGSHSWNLTVGHQVFSSPAIAADGTIYVGAADAWGRGKLYAVNPYGSEKWSATITGLGIHGPVDSSPAIAADGTIYIGVDGYLHAIDPIDGSQKWSFPTEEWVMSSPAIGADGTIYIGSCDDKLYAINPDGTQRWIFPTGSDVQSSPAIGTDGTIYVGSCDGKLYAIDPDGTQKWSFTITGPTIVPIHSSPAIAADGTIYVGAHDDKLHAINPNGSQNWSSTTGAAIYSTPAIGADGTIYVGSCDDKLYAINPVDGSQKWSFTTGDWITSSPAIGADGTIYIGSDDHNLYAIGGMYTLTIPYPLGPTVGFPCSDYSVTDPGCGTFTYDAGTVVNLVAEAKEGCCFVEWIGDVGTIDNVNAASTTITMEGNYIVVPRFEECTPNGGCFIATAAYGTPMAEEIKIFREFRDGYLLTNPVGQALVDIYYRVSPPMADFITEHPSLKPIVRAGLLPAVVMSTIAVNTTPAGKAVIIGLLVLVSVAPAVWTTRRRGRGSEYNQG